MSPLVNAAWLISHHNDPSLRLVDVRWYLTGRNGDEEYRKGHIPGAVFLDLDRDISASSGPGRHPIPEAEQFTVAMRRAGVGRDTYVVAYDDAGGSIAARLWWLLRYFGHERVSILDGGLPAWVALGGKITHEVPRPEQGDFTVRMKLSTNAHGSVANTGSATQPVSVNKHYVNDRRLLETTLLLDARAPERYRGESEPVDARPGHIPNARSAPWLNNLKDGRFKSAAELRKLYADLGAERAGEIVVYCGSGVTACHDLLALELAGFGAARLYEGSWSDWAADSTLPAEKGPGKSP